MPRPTLSVPTRPPAQSTHPTRATNQENQKSGEQQSNSGQQSYGLGRWLGQSSHDDPWIGVSRRSQYQPVILEDMEMSPSSDNICHLSSRRGVDHVQNGDRHSSESENATLISAATTPLMGRSERFKSESDVATTLSSSGNLQRDAYQSATLEEGKNRVRLSNPKDSTRVFELLRSESADDDIDLTVEDIITWANAMDLTPGHDRRQHVSQLLSDLDSKLSVNSTGGVKYCAPRRSDGRSERKSVQEPLKSMRNSANQVKRNRTRSRISQKSGRESEGSTIPSVSITSTSQPFVKMLSCPFVKRNPARYILVNNSCTERFGFPSPGKLVEHLKRVHSLRVPCCIVCKQRFHGKTRAQAEQSQELHESLGTCQQRDLEANEPEWMTEEEDTRFASSVIQGQSTSAEEKWGSIYRQIFAVPERNDIPDPYYDFLVPRQFPDFIHPGAQATEDHSRLPLPILEEPRAQSPILQPFGPHDWNSIRDEIPDDGQIEPASGEIYQTYNPSGHNHPSFSQLITSLARTTPGDAQVSMLTSSTLELNELSQPETPFAYGILHGEDSAYHSHGQETVKPTNHGREHQTQGASSGEPELGSPAFRESVVNSSDAVLYDSALDLVGLEMQPLQFPESARIDGHRKNGL